MFVYLPNYAIEYFLSTEQVGQFAAVSYFLVAGGILINSLSQAVTPKLSNLYHQQQAKAFISLTLTLMAVGAGIGLVGLGIVTLIGEWLLQLMYTSAIAKLLPELQLIVVASLIRYSYIFLGSALNVLKCLNQQVYVYGSGTISLALALYYLTPAYQTQGVAIAMIIGCAVEFCVMTLLFANKWQAAKQAFTPVNAVQEQPRNG